MSTIAIAKKDFQDGIRSELLIGLIALFSVFIIGATLYATEIDPRTKGTSDMGAVMEVMVVPTYVLLPIIGTLIGYKAIVGERTTGSLKFLLGLPHSRRDVVVGKFLGRGALIAVAVLVGFAVGGVALFALTKSFAAADYIVYVLLTILLGVTFVSIAIAFSLATRSSSVVIGGAITLVLLFLFLWDLFLMLVRYVATELGLITSAQDPTWILFLPQLNPTQAYIGVLGWATDPESQTMVEQTLDHVPFYLEGWFGFVILAFWLLVPIGIGMIRFERADL